MPARRQDRGEQQLPPADADLERAVLGACLIDQGCLPNVVDVLDTECFWETPHRLIWNAITKLYGRGEPVDLITVTNELRKHDRLKEVGGAYALALISHKVASAENVLAHARILVELQLRRLLLQLAAAQGQMAYDHAMDVFDLYERSAQGLSDALERYARSGMAIYATHERHELEAMDRPHKGSVPTGFYPLDAAMGGWVPGNLVLLGGRPGMGKTSSLLSLANALANTGTPTAVLQMELTRTENQARLVAIRTGLPLADMIHGRIGQQGRQRREQAAAQVAELPLYIRYETGLSLTEIRADVRRLVRAHGVRVVFIDQLNWIEPPPTTTRNDALGAVSRKLKQIALQEEVTIVVGHQLNRASETRGGDKRPVMSDLRDSGNLEQDAQVVMFCYRPEYYSIAEDDEGPTAGRLDWIIAKNSNGPTQTVRMMFDGPTTSVTPASNPMDPTPPPFTEEPF